MSLILLANFNGRFLWIAPPLMNRRMDGGAGHSLFALLSLCLCFERKQKRKRNGDILELFWRVVTFGGQIQPFSDRFRTVFGAFLDRFRLFLDNFRIILHGFHTVFFRFFASRRRGAAAASSRCRCGRRCGRRRGRAAETTTRNRRLMDAALLHG